MMKQERKAIVRILSILLAVMVAAGFSLTMTEEVSAAPKTPAKVKIVSAKSDHEYGGVIITWKKAKNAKLYEIHYATKKNGPYKQLTGARKSDRSARGFFLKPGKKYYFKVRAINGSKKGKFSAVKSAKAVVRQPKFDGFPYRLELASEKNVKLNIDANPNNYDYSFGVEIYRATGKDGKYKKIKTIKSKGGKTIDSYVDENLSAEKYYYKLRAYHKVGKKTVYSKYSKVESITVPKKITITMDNWDNYFEIAEETSVERDDFGDLTQVYYEQVLTLKDKYEGQQPQNSNGKEFVKTDIAYEMAYTVGIRNVSMDKDTGKLTLGAEIAYSDDEDAEYPYEGTQMDTINARSYNNEVIVGDRILDTNIYLDDTTMKFIKDFRMLRVQGTLYLTKW